MPSTMILNWTVWGVSVLFGVAAVVALLKLQFSQRFLPQWDELKDLDGILAVRREEARQLTEARDRYHSELGQLEADVGHLRILKEWQDANPDAPARIQQMMLDLERSKSELAAIQQKLAQDEQRLNESLQESNRLAQEKVQLTQDAVTLREQIVTLQKQKADHEATVRDWEDRERHLAIRLSALKTEAQAAESRLADLQQQLKQAEQEKAAAVRECDQARADRDAAKAEFEGLKKMVETYKAHVENIKTELQLTGGGKTDVAKALEDLAQPVLNFAFTGSADSNEQTALLRFRDHLKSKSLHYPERVQLAFHTSLKAAHINPLVVLAGVSGTGKSALPKAYAEAVGMNFLSLAVQPGWSGPQDLLGFYNYLERKYKATDLARALAQMSRHSEKDLPGLKVASRDKQMLLLLLDEMNLARIEYYFSDFLSRLEQRGGGNIDDDQRRREVSLHVDVGSLVAGEMARYIFPDFNVLFVGTMNEDESTHSLSEKVVDRANVLRFGAPKHLQVPATDKSAPTQEFLPRRIWKGWVKHFDGNGFETERQMLEDMNNVLDTVHRPFGHRVYRAVLDYLANYPEAATNAEHRRHAVADQIEQKVIPKLRGLDTQDDATGRCLDQLENTITTLEDNDLTEAFKAARGQHLFEWYGVKRS